LVFEHVGLLELFVATLAERVLTFHVSFHLLGVGDLLIADLAFHGYHLRNEV